MNAIYKYNRFDLRSLCSTCNRIWSSLSVSYWNAPFRIGERSLCSNFGVFGWIFITQCSRFKIMTQLKFRFVPFTRLFLSVFFLFLCHQAQTLPGKWIPTGSRPFLSAFKSPHQTKWMSKLVFCSVLLLVVVTLRTGSLCSSGASNNTWKRCGKEVVCFHFQPALIRFYLAS